MTFDRKLAVVLLALVPLAHSSAGQQSNSAPLVTDDPVALRQDVAHAEVAQPLEEADVAGQSPLGEYRVGSEDLLEISVLDAPDLNRSVRVSDDGSISLPLIGSLQAANLTTRELESLLEGRLQQQYMKDPQVTVFVQEMRSHPVSVFGAVAKPGVYQIRVAKPLIEVLSMAEGLTSDAGNSVVILRPTDQALADSIKMNSGISFGDLSTLSGNAGLEKITVGLNGVTGSSESPSSVLVYPGDAINVPRAGIVYVVGEVHKPGGFLLKNNEDISVLQAIALSEGTTTTSEPKQSRIILASDSGSSRKEMRIDLDKILAGKAPDPVLKPNDILFIPNSPRKAAMHGLAQNSASIVAAVSYAAVYRW